MAWRFKTSKFKNTIPHMPKKGDTIYDLPLSTVTSTNNGIVANDALYAFHIDGDGGKLGILPISTRGRKLRQNISVLCAHTESIQDLCFLPFSSNVLATCAKDERVKLWQLDPNGNAESCLNDPLSCINNDGHNIESLCAHPNASNILAAGHNQGLLIADVSQEKVALDLSMEDCERLHSLSWNGNGRTLAASCKNGSVVVFDPRAQTSPVNTASGHSGMSREGRVLWLGDMGKLLSSGFTKTKNREIIVYDERNWATPFVTQQHQPSTGILMPLYDPDTKLIFLAGKGSNKMMIYEMTERDPYLAEVTVHNAPEQTIGCCLRAKRSLNVMKGEVDVFVQLTKTSIVPVSCTVIRTSYRDFISDLFPDTVCGLAGCTGAEWLNGCNDKPPKFSLDPAKKDLMDIMPSKIISNNTPSSPAIGLGALRNKKNMESAQNGDSMNNTVYFTPPEIHHISNGVNHDQENKSPASPLLKDSPVRNSPFLNNRASLVEKAPPTSPKPVVTQPVEHKPKSVQLRKLDLGANTDIVPEPAVRMRPNPAPQNAESRKSTWNAPRTSKYKHMKVNVGVDMGKVMFTNLRSANLNMPNESNGFCVSAKWAAIPMASGPAGTVAILDLDKPNKLPDGIVLGLENKSKVNDLVWCPFDDDQLACGCDNGVVNIWTIEGPLISHPKPIVSFAASNERVIIIRYHPTAEDLLAVVAGNDVTLWDLQDPSSPRITLRTHEKPVISLAWNPYGKQLVTIAKDLKMHVFEPLSSTSPIESQQVMERMGHARSFYACNGRMICVSHFTRGMKRVLSVFKTNPLQLVHTEPVGDSCSALLVPQFDFDSNIVFLTGKGDRTLHMFEIIDDKPWMLPLQIYSEKLPHQGISIHAKNVCDVKKTEVARGWIMTNSCLKRLSFTVPRRESHLFAPEIFPNALVTWESVTTCKDWFHGEGANILPKFVSLKPADMSAAVVNEVKAAPKPSAVVEPATVTSAISETNNNERVDDEPKPTARQSVTPVASARTSIVPVLDQDDIDKRVKLVDSLLDAADTMDVGDKELEQDNMEGVDEKEWQDD